MQAEASFDRPFDGFDTRAEIQKFARFVEPLPLL
jgi:hypothetical protein